MGGSPFPSLSLRFTFFLSLSLATATSSPLLLIFPSSQNNKPPKATTKDLLSLLDPTNNHTTINPLVSQQLKSCFKFIVPFSPPNPNPFSFNDDRDPPRELLIAPKLDEEERENQLVWWPPEPVLDLARLAFDSGGNPDSIHRIIDPTIIPVPDCEGSIENRCHLTRTPFGRHFISEELNSYLEFLFKLIVDRGPSIGLNVSLNRYDFFHGHMFIATDTGRLGILFHAKEYPAFDKQVFPYNMGYCQTDDFGEVVVDVNYLNIGDADPRYQLFIC
ncbi:hypothetical protein ACFE04_006036 [Oxalis oulophora]